MNSPAFVADLHLRPGDGPSLERLSRWLELVGERTGSLYILGDLFDFWVGPGMERWTPLAPVLETLAASPLRITFLPGNRDFLFRPDRLRTAAISGSEEETLITGPDGKGWLLLHGDQLCTDDLPYQRARRILRSPPIRWAANLLPFFLRIGAARFLRRGSRRSLAARVDSTLHPTRKALEDRLGREGVDALVCGHFHRLGTFALGSDQARVLYSLPPWQESGGWALLGSSGLELLDGDGTPLEWPSSSPL